MKTIPCLLLASAGLAATLALVAADQSKALRVLAEAGGPETKTERHVRIRHGFGPREMETVAFLGVETARVGEALTAQLELPKGIGLIVREVMPDSPAAAALQAHDILLKLDDQWLIESRQFSVLVRNRHEGDEVTLTYVRAGKQATAKVKLGKHEAPKLGFFEFSGGDEKAFGFRWGEEAESGGRPHGEPMKRVLSLLDRDRRELGDRPRRVELPHPGFRAMRVNPGNSNMVYTDEQGTLELTIKDGAKSLVAKDAKGEQVFAGPIDTPEQRKALPAAVRERLEQIESMQDFSFEPDEVFQRDVKFIRPDATRIVLPLSEGEPAWTGDDPAPSL